MERRQMLKYLLAGGLSAGVSVPLQAQQKPRPPGLAQVQINEPQQGIQQVGAAQVADSMDPAAEEELNRVLLDWEQKTARITKLRGEHQRYEYDSVFQVEKRSVGSFWYQTPDKGRIDFNVDGPPPLPNPPVNHKKKGPNGVPFGVAAAEAEIWLCDGINVLSIHVDQKTYDQLQIPPHQRGKNVIDGPLPFLFGMKADKVKGRYKMTLGPKHNKTGHSGRPEYHIIAKPLKPEDAREWSTAEVLLDAKFCLPTAIRLLDPAATKETVYVFDLGTMKANEPKLHPSWVLNPFKPQLNGYKVLQNATKDVEPLPKNANTLPASRSK